MNLAIVPIAADHIVGFRNALDRVARERKFLAFFEAPALEQMPEFVLDNIRNGHTQLVALGAGRILAGAGRSTAD